MATEQQAELVAAAYEAGFTSQRELANFMAQVTQESAGLTRLSESFIYSKNLTQVPVRSVRDKPIEGEDARLEALRGRPEKLAEMMYGGRMGNNEPGDGYRYRGRGYIQLTGKNNYRAAQEALGVDFLNNPDLAATRENAIKLSIWFWKENIHNIAPEDIDRATKIINVGSEGLEYRRRYFAEWQERLTPDVMQGLAQGEMRLPVGQQIASHGQKAHQIETMGVLRERDKGDGVSELQNHLHDLGYTDTRGLPLVPDGQFGSNTRHAVKTFQRDHGLSVDGVTGSNTWAALQAAARTASITGATTPLVIPEAIVEPFAVTFPQLTPDLDAASIRTLQQHLNTLGITDHHGQALPITGVYDIPTRIAVADFQLKQRLPGTGLADPATYALIEARATLAELQHLTPERAVPPPEASSLTHAPVSPLIHEQSLPPAPGAMTALPMSPVVHPLHHTPGMTPLPSAPPDRAQTDAVNQREDVSPPLPQGLPTIRDLQGHLTTLGLTGPTGQPLRVTGRLDPETRYATQHFQAAFGLNPTGSPDRATLDAAREQAAAMALPQAPTMTRMPPSEPPPAAAQPVTVTQDAVPSHLHTAALAARLAATTAHREGARQQQEDAQRQEAAREEARAAEPWRTASHHPETVSPILATTAALWTPEPLSPPHVPATFADPNHPKHYRYETLLEQVQEAPALQGYTADQHARIAAGLTYVTDQRREFIIQDLRAIDVQGNTLIVTDRLKIGQESNVVHGNLSFMLSKTPEETASAWREWALPKQSTPGTHVSESVDPQPVLSTDMRHPQEPHHAMFLEVRRKLGATYTHHGMTRDPEQLDREAARVTVTLRERQFGEVPTLRLACETDGRFSTQPGLRAVSDFSMVKFNGEDLRQAPPVEQSSQTLVQVEQRLQEQAMAFEQQWAQQAGLGRTR